jgi:hypothetical protein
MAVLNNRAQISKIDHELVFVVNIIYVHTHSIEKHLCVSVGFITGYFTVDFSRQTEVGDETWPCIFSHYCGER